MAIESLSTISSQQETHIIKQYFQCKMLASFYMTQHILCIKKQNSMH